jgi:serine/threonine protein kinase
MNILLTDKNQTLKLGDMSESRMLDHNNYLRQPNKVVGTPLSLSPEVV